MKQRIRACRIVFVNGDVVMHYLDNCCCWGMVRAGRKNMDVPNILVCSRKKFEDEMLSLYSKNQSNENIEYIEFI